MKKNSASSLAALAASLTAMVVMVMTGMTRLPHTDAEQKEKSSSTEQEKGNLHTTGDDNQLHVRLDNGHVEIYDDKNWPVMIFALPEGNKLIAQLVMPDRFVLNYPLDSINDRVRQFKFEMTRGRCLTDSSMEALQVTYAGRAFLKKVNRQNGSSCYSFYSANYCFAFEVASDIGVSPQFSAEQYDRLAEEKFIAQALGSIKVY